jgi:hypothetical protein
VGKDLEVYVDASFCGDCNPLEAMTDKDTARSRHGYIINYAGCPEITVTKRDCIFCIQV